MSEFEEIFPHGKVELIDSMGCDLRVVNAARVSHAKHKDVFDPEDDGRIIKFMAGHNHWTPFAHVMVTFRITMPIFVIREWYRHEVGFVRNEESRRYVDYTPELHIPDTLRKRGKGVKQGSGKETLPMPVFAKRLMFQCLNTYESLLQLGVAPEQARIVLPQAMYTSFYETASLAAYARLCKLRIAPDAQREIRLYAEEIDRHISNVAPESWNALMTARPRADD